MDEGRCRGTCSTWQISSRLSFLKMPLFVRKQDKPNLESKVRMGIRRCFNSSIGSSSLDVFEALPLRQEHRQKLDWLGVRSPSLLHRSVSSPSKQRIAELRVSEGGSTSYPLTRASMDLLVAARNKRVVVVTGASAGVGQVNRRWLRESQRCHRIDCAKNRTSRIGAKRGRSDRRSSPRGSGRCIKCSRR